MVRKTQISILVIGLMLVFGAVGAWAVDASQASRIAKGVTVGGIDIGDRSAAAAAARLRSDLVAPLARPVTVRFGGKSYKLGPRRAKMHADIDGMIAEAKQVSRSAPLPSRLWRYATGGEVSRSLTPRITYSHAAVQRFVDYLGGEIDRPAQDATVRAGPSSVNPVPSRKGVRLNSGALRAQIETALEDPVGARSLHATVRHIDPKITTATVAEHYPTYVTVDRGSFRLNLYKHLKLVKSYPIAVGMAGLETPAGLYHIQDKGENVAWHVPNSDWAGSLAGKVIPGGSPDNPIKARWMGIFDGAGIHGTTETGSLGSAASHGCIRMAIPDVIELYPQVSVGTPVYIGN
ncbi:MAG: L,D-transpeptidase ErfK/SrfK [Solirubrobacterales bacterium]|jgi:lipoprotein-anchoring transpeptidase ErfK/SrfK|nr:L,D-transpeptidase ErfK/SrfK [Solirubrobacterales bacterium]